MDLRKVNDDMIGLRLIGLVLLGGDLSFLFFFFFLVREKCNI